MWHQWSCTRFLEMIGSFLALQFLDILKLSRSSMFFLNFKPDFRKTCQCFQYVSVFHTHHLNIRPNSFLFGILNSSMFISIFRGVSIVIGSTPKNHPFSWKSNGDFPLSILIFMGSSSIKIYLGGFVMGYPQLSSLFLGFSLPKTIQFGVFLWVFPWFSSTPT